ncbi:hypothetical protein [Leptospira stimsonii]|uniref:Uncharacterized protein n=1 Tax=Leptospira stimsonii TaxID=2202203 RepID=A0A4R9KZQ8_9LEPT|nr:hypothetical protein [Leptospira stimsonii]RHX88183.1 hypothetical protein DLM78_04305 [Leptospira stimsonii]TGK23883.1 hypothetical protein EHO98_04275 [Leptospira stimsonii]TGM10409.1 hypothetical protein EHQ90_18245 [Leptospira stimsonii]
MKFLTWVAVNILFLSFCSTTQKVYLLSYGNLEGKKIPEGVQNPAGEIREGKDCGFYYSLAKAFENAILNTKYDTILDAEVTHTTGPFAPMHCVLIKGLAVNSGNFFSENER